MQRWKLGWLAIAGASALTMGCAHGPPPSELTAARQAYQQVSTSPEGRERPADVAAARAALQEAENEYAQSKGSEKTRSLAYVALRKAEIAEARGEADLAAQQRAEAEQLLRQHQESRAQTLARQQQEERERYEQQRQLYEQQRQQYDAQRQQEAERMRTANAQQQEAESQRLAQLNQELQQRTQQLEQERQARLQAEQRASHALTRLQDENVKVREEARGTVVTLSGSVLFATNATSLLPASRDRLSDVATALKESRNPLIIEGYTDSRGTEEYNDQLSERRAESVRDFLVAQGVPRERIQIRGMGKSRPVASNATAEGRANNRRVEIVVERNVAGAQPSRSSSGVGGSGEEPKPQGSGIDHQNPAPDQGTGGSGAQKQVPEQPMDHGE